MRAGVNRVVTRRGLGPWSCLAEIVAPWSCRSNWATGPRDQLPCRAKVLAGVRAILGRCFPTTEAAQCNLRFFERMPRGRGR